MTVLSASTTPKWCRALQPPSASISILMEIVRKARYNGFGATAVPLFSISFYQFLILPPPSLYVFSCSKFSYFIHSYLFDYKDRTRCFYHHSSIAPLCPHSSPIVFFPTYYLGFKNPRCLI